MWENAPECGVVEALDTHSAGFNIAADDLQDDGAVRAKDLRARLHLLRKLLVAAAHRAKGSIHGTARGGEQEEEKVGWMNTTFGKGLISVRHERSLSLSIGHYNAFRARFRFCQLLRTEQDEFLIVFDLCSTALHMEHALHDRVVL